MKFIYSFYFVLNKILNLTSQRGGGYDLCEIYS